MEEREEDETANTGEDKVVAIFDCGASPAERWRLNETSHSLRNCPSLSKLCLKTSEAFADFCYHAHSQPLHHGTIGSDEAHSGVCGHGETASRLLGMSLSGRECFTYHGCFAGLEVLLSVLSRLLTSECSVSVRQIVSCSLNDMHTPSHQASNWTGK